jgi:hypothetical protein
LVHWNIAPEAEPAAALSATIANTYLISLSLQIELTKQIAAKTASKKYSARSEFPTEIQQKPDFPIKFTAIHTSETSSQLILGPSVSPCSNHRPLTKGD